MSIGPFDRGFTLGDGIFETLKITNSMPELWEHHIRRLKQGCKIMHLDCPQDLYEHALSLIEKNNVHSAILKIIISRQSLHRGLAINAYPEVNITMTLSPLPKPPLLIKAHISTIKRNETSPLSRIKSLNYGDNILAFQRALDAGYDDALMVNTQNQPCCFTIGNIVIETQEGDLLTPPFDTGCLDGTFLKTIPKLIYKNFTLKQAVKIWRSNSISGLCEVKLDLINACPIK